MKLSPTLESTLTALADPTRRAILQRLSSGETRVTDIAKPFDMSLNAVSKHIRVLERARLVNRRRAGREFLLSINLAPLDAAASWIEAQRTAWAKKLQMLDDMLEEEDRAGSSTTTRTAKRGRSR